jgi:hypothetical protein
MQITRNDPHLHQALDYFRLLPHYQLGTCGRFSIRSQTIPPGEKVEVAYPPNPDRFFDHSWNCPLVTDFDEAFTFYELHEQDNGLWASASLSVVAQIDEPVGAAHGHVLVGGLSLGVVPHLLVQQKNVKTVTVVERESDLITLVGPFLDRRIEIVQADVFDYLRSIKPGQFDFAYFDLWLDRIVGWSYDCDWAWEKEVVPLRRLLAQKIPQVLCWHEDMMAGDVYERLFRSVKNPADNYERNRLFQPCWVFHKALEAVRAKLRLDPAKQKELKELQIVQCHSGRSDKLRCLARQFVDKIGSESWEEHFGQLWDQTMQWPDP